MYDTILIPTDGSPFATQAVEEGLQQAVRFDAVVHLLYVVDTNRGPEGGWDIVVERLEAEGETALDEGVERARELGCSATRHLRRGAPSEEILDAAAAYEVDLIIMGTAGRSGLSRMLHPGSTAERVVRGSRLPVTVVPPNPDENE